MCPPAAHDDALVIPRAIDGVGAGVGDDLVVGGAPRDRNSLLINPSPAPSWYPVVGRATTRLDCRTRRRTSHWNDGNCRTRARRARILPAVMLSGATGQW